MQQRQQQSLISSSGLTIASQILILSSASLRGPSVIRRGTRHTHDSTSSRPTWDEKRSRACLTSSQQCSEQTCRNSPPQNYNPTACDMHAVSSNSSFPWIYRRIRTQTTCEHAQTHQHLSTSPLPLVADVTMLKPINISAPAPRDHDSLQPQHSPHFPLSASGRSHSSSLPPPSSPSAHT